MTRRLIRVPAGIQFPIMVNGYGVECMMVGRTITKNDEHVPVPIPIPLFRFSHHLIRAHPFPVVVFVGSLFWDGGRCVTHPNRF